MAAPAVVGIGMTAFGRFPDLSLKNLAATAVTQAVQDAGIDLEDIGVAFVANAYAGLITGQESVRAQTVLAPLGLGAIPVLTVENACAGGSTALWLAQQAVATGQVRYALALGVEKMVTEDKTRAISALATSRDIEESEEESATPFMELYAEELTIHGKAAGSTPEDFAQVAVKNRNNAALNPIAQYQKAITVEDVLDSPTIYSPLTLLMCSPVTDGAAAAIIGPADIAPRAPRIVASILRAGHVPAVGYDEPTDMRVTALAAYEQAGLGPEDIHVAEVHDAASPGEIIAYEDLGFAGPGAGVDLLRSGATAVGGRIPVNTSGGLTSRGHPVGATGIAMAVQIVEQLRGVCGARQREGARIGLTHNSGGWVAGAPAATAVHIIQLP